MRMLGSVYEKNVGITNITYLAIQVVQSFHYQAQNKIGRLTREMLNRWLEGYACCKQPILDILTFKGQSRWKHMGEIGKGLKRKFDEKALAAVG